NPPWISIELDEAGILAERNPEILVRDLTAPQVKTKSKELVKNDSVIANLYVNESIWAEATKTFLGSFQNYPLLNGQRNNLYKCILTNALALANNKGYIGLVHPETIYDDPRA